MATEEIKSQGELAITRPYCWRMPPSRTFIPAADQFNSGFPTVDPVKWKCGEGQRR